MTKYKEYFGKMVETNKELFDQFAKIHTDYGLDEAGNQEKLNQVGGEVLKVIHEWENRLCRQSEKAGYTAFTGGLSEKFQAEVKNHFPLIDHVGIIIKKHSPASHGFSIKKINFK